MNKNLSPQDSNALVRDAVANQETFLRLTLSGELRGAEVPWVKVTVRPVLVRGRRQLQFSFFDGKKDISKNYADEEALAKLEETLVMPFSRVHVQATDGDLHVRITKKGKALVGRGRPSRPEHEPLLAHDREKSRPMPAAEAADFLHAIGLADASGRLRPSMSGKFHQINEFLQLMAQALGLEESPPEAIEIIDCGCGNAYLTFAAYHYLRTRGIAVRVTGVDSNEEIIARCLELRDSLGWPDLEFHCARIADYAPTRPPGLVLSLHACDTATDEAIAQGVRWGSQVILAAPCCQHELHTQLRAEVMRPMLRHGILKERTADLLTDAFRALLLRILGYRTDVVQFVSPEHTTKNLMIRAVKGLPMREQAFLREYQELKQFWGVQPHLETLFGAIGIAIPREEETAT